MRRTTIYVRWNEDWLWTISSLILDMFMTLRIPAGGFVYGWVDINGRNVHEK
jgi:hypothetical protein